MNSEFLPAYVQNALYENVELLPRISGTRPRLKDVRAFCQNYRIAAIGSLLLDGTPEAFQKRLFQSGRAFASFLARTDDVSKETSKSEPFWDAIAALDWDGAKRIALHSRRTWAQGQEYEEDFLFFDLVMQQLFLDAPPEAGSSMLAHWEKILQGSEDPRLPVCAALLEKDSGAFDAALELHLRERESRLAALAEKGALADPVQWTEGQLAIEGVALARLAQRMGMPLQREYPQVPGIVLEYGPATFDALSWTQVEAP